MGYQLGTGLAVGIGVISVQGVAFPVAILPLPVLINLVRGHIEEGAHTVRQPDTLQHVHGSHNICLIGIHRVLIRIPHNGLGCQMKHHLRPHPFKHVLKSLKIPDITNHAVHHILQPGNFKQAWVCGRLKGIPRHPGPGQGQYPAEPGPLKPGMPCHQYLLSLIKVRQFFHRHKIFISYQIFQGALPDCHSPSSLFISRWVSMHCQNPL